MANSSDEELRKKIAESIRVRGIASSILNMAMPTFKALGELLEVEGYYLTKGLKTNNNESESFNKT